MASKSASLAALSNSSRMRSGLLSEAVGTVPSPDPAIDEWYAQNLLMVKEFAHPEHEHDHTDHYHQQTKLNQNQIEIHRDSPFVV